MLWTLRHFRCQLLLLLLQWKCFENNHICAQYRKNDTWYFYETCQKIYALRLLVRKLESFEISCHLRLHNFLLSTCVLRFIILVWAHDNTVRRYSQKYFSYSIYMKYAEIIWYFTIFVGILVTQSTQQKIINLFRVVLPTWFNVNNIEQYCWQLWTIWQHSIKFLVYCSWTR